MKTIICSDWHLGSDVSNKDKIINFLENLQTDVLILNGDIIDHNTRKLKTKDWKILLLLKKISKKTKVVWIRGNHGQIIEPIIANLMGIEYLLDYVILNNNKRIFIFHGDRIDSWATKEFISEFFTGVYYFIQKFDTKERAISTWLKIKSKEILKIHKNMEKKGLNYAKTNHYETICVGHSHIAGKIIEDNISYFNSGSWCEPICHYILIEDNKEPELKEF